MNEPSTELTSIYYYGTILGSDYNTLSPVFTASTNVFGIDDVSSTNANYSDPNNDPWYYSLFDNLGSGVYSGFSYWSTITGLTITPQTTTTTIAPSTTTTTTNPCITTTTSTTTTTTQAPVYCYSGSLVGTIYVYSGTAYTDYDDLVIATLRSRGITNYST